MINIKNENRVPKVGPFYIINNKIYAEHECINDLNKVGDFKDSNNEHYTYWDKLCKEYPDFSVYEYDYYPRGRVIYNVAKNVYTVYVDACINDEGSISLILDEFDIPSNHYNVEEESHYKCHSCNNLDECLYYKI